jgi:hypothetical protein
VSARGYLILQRWLRRLYGLYLGIVMRWRREWLGKLLQSGLKVTWPAPAINSLQTDTVDRVRRQLPASCLVDVRVLLGLPCRTRFRVARHLNDWRLVIRHVGLLGCALPLL